MKLYFSGDDGNDFGWSEKFWKYIRENPEITHDGHVGELLAEYGGTYVWPRYYEKAHIVFKDESYANWFLLRWS